MYNSKRFYTSGKSKHNLFINCEKLQYLYFNLIDYLEHAIQLYK